MPDTLTPAAAAEAAGLAAKSREFASVLDRAAREIRRTGTTTMPIDRADAIHVMSAATNLVAVLDRRPQPARMPAFGRSLACRLISLFD